MTAADVAVTVLVTTRNRREMLGRLLDCLADQTLPHDVIVVDDASSDGTKDLLDERGVRCVPGRGSGLAAARNLSVAAATTPVVAFTDDDCRPARTWLAHLVAPILEGRADMTHGVTLPDPEDEAQRGPWSHTMDVPVSTRSYPTCNVAYRLDLVQAVGGFDEQFRHAGEDTDLAWRALEAGARVAAVPSAVVHHAIWPSNYWGHLARMRRWRDVPRVVRRHPGIRAAFFRKYFWKSSHVRASKLVGATLLVGLLDPWLIPIPLAVISTRVAWRSRDLSPRGIALNGLRLLGDVHETSWVVIGAIRARTLLL